MKLKEKIIDRLLEFSLEKVVVFFTLISGITAYTLWSGIKRIFNYKLEIEVSVLITSLFLLICVLFILYYIFKRLKSKQKFSEGTQVILTSKNSPAISAGKFNFLNNKVLCSWHYNKAYHEKWINQNQLEEYEFKPFIPKPRNSSRSVWDY
ncbi:MAG: hypothetical protein ACXWFB_11685 [Nitrososphaeraceae archaeon]